MLGEQHTRQTQKKKDMATLKDLCIIPSEMLQAHEQREYIRKERMKIYANYKRCMAQIDAMGANGLTRICEGKRIRKRCKITGMEFAELGVHDC